MRQRISFTFVGILGTVVLLAGFQNCASKDVPTISNSHLSSSGAIGPVPKYFIGKVKQDAVVITQGGTWKDIPGATLTFELPRDTTVNMRALGSITSVAGSQYSSGHCGFRFVIDGVVNGDPTWGNVLVGVNGGGANTAWWSSWSAEAFADLTVGSHTISLQQVGWHGTDSGCKSQVEDFSAAKLIIEAQ